MEVVNIEGENLRIFWTTWEISMKFSEKMWLMIIFKVTKSQGFIFSLKDTFLGKTQKGSNYVQYKVCWILYKMAVLFPFHNPTCANNQPYNLHQNVSSINFTSLFYPYLFIKLFLQSPLTLTSSMSEHYLCVQQPLQSTSKVFSLF